MLGIIFTGGEGPDTQVIKQLFKTEIDLKNTLVIAADSGLVAAQNAGIKPDWIIGDMDSLGTSTEPLCGEGSPLVNHSRLSAYPPERVIRHDHDKDFTDTELAFILAAEKGCNVIWIIGGGGGRIDHLLGIHSLFERELFPRRWITGNADIYCIDAEIIGNEKLTINNDQKIENRAGVIVSVFPLGAGPWEAESGGLKWQLKGVSWNRGFFGLSNVALDGSFSVTAKHGRFMIILPYKGTE